MANRHAHKKLRAEALQASRQTGESYQRALQRIVSRRGSKGRRRTCQGPQAEGTCDLIAVDYFGQRATLATFECLGHTVLMLVPHPFRGRPFPTQPLCGWTSFGGRVLA